MKIMNSQIDSTQGDYAVTYISVDSANPVNCSPTLFVLLCNFVTSHVFRANCVVVPSDVTSSLGYFVCLGFVYLFCLLLEIG